MIRDTAGNPDTFFQSREACNRFCLECPKAVQQAMDRFAERTGRQYRLFDFFGQPGAERVIVLKASGAQTVQETVELLGARGEKWGWWRCGSSGPLSASTSWPLFLKRPSPWLCWIGQKEPGALVILSEPLDREETEVSYAPRDGEGFGLVETSRGPLIHHWVIEQGKIARADFIIPTVHIVRAIERALRVAAERHITADQVNLELERAVGRVGRAFDPCIASATH